MVPADSFQGINTARGRANLRALTHDDTEDLRTLLNSLIDVGADIENDTHQTIEEATSWVSRAMSGLEDGSEHHLIAEMDGEVIGRASIYRYPFECDKHMADLGTMIRPGYWDLGLGSKMLRIVMDQAREAGIEILFLIVFSSNLRAIHVYEKMGFKENGRIPSARACVSSGMAYTSTRS
ncbi:MAG: GNAT family N-acetyltransferase [Candidatus Bathyarchaeota archaeon]|nr:GNAT family N-acetyltransferase [Candidatus Bathyarchaeota archaeon]